MPVTDLQRVAQYAKSDRTAPPDVHNAACRLLDTLRAAPERPTPPDDTTATDHVSSHGGEHGGLRDQIAEVLVRRHTNGLCPLDGPCDCPCDCFDPKHRQERETAGAVLAEITPALARLQARAEHAEDAAQVNRERATEFRQQRDALKAAIERAREVLDAAHACEIYELVADLRAVLAPKSPGDN